MGTMRHMVTVVLVALSVLIILIMLGAALMFSYLCGAVGGAVVGWALGVKDEPQGYASMLDIDESRQDECGARKRERRRRRRNAGRRT